MSSLIFLIAVVVLSLIGALVLWLRERSPRSMESHIRAFERERQALSPDSWPGAAPPRRPGPDAPPRTKGRRAG